MAGSLPKWEIRQHFQQNSIQFHFPFIPLSFDGQKHKISKFLFGWGACFGWHDHQICILKKNNLDFDHQLYVLLFTPMEGKCTPVDNNYKNEHISLYSWCFDDNLKYSFSWTVKELYSVTNHFLLGWPSPPLDPGCHFDKLCECVKHACWQKGVLGHGCHTQPRINGKTLMGQDLIKGTSRV